MKLKRHTGTKITLATC